MLTVAIATTHAAARFVLCSIMHLPLLPLRPFIRKRIDKYLRQSHGRERQFQTCSGPNLMHGSLIPSVV